MYFQNNKKDQSNGFTLVELLVVITMIAVLAGIIFTMTSKAMERSHVVTCMNNLRQIGLGLNSYNGDNQGYPSKNDGISWDRAILPYMGYTGDKDLSGSARFTKSSWPELATIAETFACKSDKYERSSTYYKRSYAIVPWTTNWSNGTDFRGWKHRPYNKGVPISIVEDPERAALVVEWHQGKEGIENNCGSGAHAYHDRGGPDSQGRDVHGNKQIVLFADGHTQMMPFISNAEFVKKYWPGELGQVD